MTQESDGIQSEIGFNVEIMVGGLPRKRKTNSERRHAKREVIRLCQEQHSCEVVLNPRPAEDGPPVVTCSSCGLEVNGQFCRCFTKPVYVPINTGNSFRKAMFNNRGIRTNS